MILLFHCIYIAINNYISRNSKPLQEIDLKTSQAVDAEQNLSFDPPVYKQRYGEVQVILLNNKWIDDIKKIVDFGSSDFKLFSFIKYLYRITEVLEVDIDEDLLIDNVFRVRPLLADYISRRSNPLNVHILKGSISDPDDRLNNTDAVIGIEIIEHLYPDILEGVPYNIFKFIKPKIAIFTTPNADFNVLFSRVHGFRHYDHKFEWTREQFESWALNITARFPNYSVSFKGIGEGPKGTENLGCCSQMSIFVKEFDVEENDSTEFSYGICTYFSLSNCFNENTTNSYKLIDFIEYPYDVDERTPQEKIRDELRYRINLMSNTNGRFYNNDLYRFEIPIDEIIYNQHSHYTTSAEARTILKEAGFKIEECIIFDKLEHCVVCEPDMDSRSSTPASDASDINVSNPYYADWTKADSEPDWDTDKDKNTWLLDNPNPEHEDAIIYANEIVHNIINNLDFSCSYENSSDSEKQKTINKKQSNKLIDLKVCLSNTNSISPLQSASNVASVNKTLKKDASYPGISDAKKKKKPKKDSGPNGIVNGILKIEEPIHENNQLQLYVEAIPPLREPIVENGDLANNNRDLEGNNYPNALENNVDVRENDNVVGPDLQDNANQEDARIIDVENRNNIEPELVVPIQEPDVPNPVNREVEFASREALFDPDSQVDLLEEFDISADGEPNNSLADLPVLQSIVFVGADDENADAQIAPVSPINFEHFPNWLLNLLGAGTQEDDETHDEPHFYCQGDGLGVHPSFIEEEFDDDSSTSDSSDSATTLATSHDEAEADPSVSELDAGSLPDDRSDSVVEQSPTATSVIELPQQCQKPESTTSSTAGSSMNSSEFFDSLDSSSENTVTKKDSES